MKVAEFDLTAVFCVRIIIEGATTAQAPWSSTRDKVIAANGAVVALAIEPTDAKYIAGIRTAVPTIAESYLKLANLMADVAKLGINSQHGKQLLDFCQRADWLRQAGTLPPIDS